MRAVLVVHAVEVAAVVVVDVDAAADAKTFPELSINKSFPPVEVSAGVLLLCRDI
ncbi:hypothetical protein [Halobacillus mangrovi]|uniref:hypothetical protein n=1 Tax=Halobacillus mangrovi TaxID=402384 RepID=UPI0012F4DCBC|nr:hypothetical protein [Halobacillus mangrovi]